MGSRTAAYGQTNVGIGIGRQTASLAAINSLLKVFERGTLSFVLSQHARLEFTHAKGEAENDNESKTRRAKKAPYAVRGHWEF